MQRADRTSKKFIVHGVVQGVGFRYFVAQEAKKLNLTGCVENTPAGELVIIAEGTAEMLDTLKVVCQKGPTAAIVESIVEEELVTPQTFKDFYIRYNE